MEFSEVLTARHSVRKFTDEPLDRAVIDAMIADAQLAPSSKNTKSTGFMVIEDKSLLQAISEMRDSGSKFMKDAAAAIVVLGDESKADLWVDNASICTTILMLSATNRSVGSCWVHVNGRPRCKSDASKGWAEDYLRELLGIKDNMRVLCVLALGYEDAGE